MLILKRATKGIPIGQSSADVYDVFDDERIIGRIMWTYIAPQERPWFWTITARAAPHPEDHGYAANREDAITDFRRQWGVRIATEAASIMAR
jgi:hypothetical protein